MPTANWSVISHGGRIIRDIIHTNTYIRVSSQPVRHTCSLILDIVDMHVYATSSRRARQSGVLRRRSDGLECAAWRRPGPIARCRRFPEDAGDASVSECTWTLSALEALRNALYKFKTYLLTYVYLYTTFTHFISRDSTLFH